MNVCVRIATAPDAELLKNMLNMYHSELGLYCAEFQDVDDNGYFDCHAHESYIEDKSIMPLIVTADGRTVGIMAVAAQPYCPKEFTFCLQDMYIVGYYRGKGVAEEAVRALFAMLPGSFCAPVLKTNARAASFFRRTFSRLTQSYTERDLDGEFILFGGTVKADCLPA